MIGYAVRRILLLVPVIWGVTAIVFVLIHIAPGDPIVSMLGLRPSAAQVDELRRSLGLDQPLPVQYWLWLTRLVHGDLGTSLLTHIPVTDSIFQRLPTTITLTAISMVWAVAVGLPLGVMSATRRDGLLDNIGRTISMIGISVPPFLSGILLILLFAVVLRWLPPGGSVDLYGPVALLLPSISLGAEFAAVVVRFTRATMLEVLEQDYVRTARAKGMSSVSVDFGHALRNASPPIITIVGLRTGVLLSGALITENVFGLPGLGTLLTGAIGLRDYPLILGTTVAMSVSFVLVNLAVDLTVAVIDPRVRAQYG